ncbi:MAG: hypothetical protein PVJ67_03095 [Candidatus Pacearchaeota archaeon]|jgi:hypothetical protein
MRKQKKLIKKLLILVGVLIFVLVILLIINSDFKTFFKSTQLIVIEDNCGVAVGNLIHEIKSEDNCKVMCNNECNVLDKSFVRVEFSDETGSCYECLCYCR